MLIILSVRVNVLPEPGPATISNGCSVVSTACFCGLDKITKPLKIF
jgi:hypothetical protein